MKTPQVIYVDCSESTQNRIYDWLSELSGIDTQLETQPDRLLDRLSKHTTSLFVLGPSAFLDAEYQLRWMEDLKRISPTSQILVLTYDPRIEFAVAALKRGAEDYLKLPVSRETLERAVRKALDQNAILEDHHELTDLWILIQNCQLISSAFELATIQNILLSTLNRLLGTSGSLIFDISDLEYPKEITSPTPLHHESGVIQLSLRTHFKQASINLQDFLSNKNAYQIIPANGAEPALFLFKFQFSNRQQRLVFSLFPDLKVHPKILEQYLLLLKNQLELAGKNIENYEGVQSLAFRDPLTDLPNLRSLQSQLKASVAKQRERHETFAVLFIDVDEFKALNDQLGHPAGDHILKLLSAQLRKYIRETDDLFRYAGDEFVALLDPCDRATALAVSERIRMSIGGFEFCLPGKVDPLTVTLSIGVAVHPDDGTQAEELLKLADQALYQAKALGKNRVSSV